MAGNSKKTWRILMWVILLPVLAILTFLAVVAYDGNVDKKTKPSTRRTVENQKSETSVSPSVQKNDQQDQSFNESPPTISVIPEKPIVSQAAALEEIKVNYNADVTDLKVSDDGRGNVRLDVYTPYLPEKKVSQYVQSLAHIASDGLYAVRKLYPHDLNVDAYVWSRNGIQLAHARAVFEEETVVSESMTLHDALK